MRRRSNGPSEEFGVLLRARRVEKGMRTIWQPSWILSSCCKSTIDCHKGLKSRNVMTMECLCCKVMCRWDGRGPLKESE